MRAHQALSGAFLTHTQRGPMILFPLGTYSGWGSALNAGYLNPDFVLPTPVMGGPLTPMVDPVLTLPSSVPTASLLPLLTDTTSTITTAATDSVTNSVSGKLAAGLEVLALAPRSSGVTIHPDGQALFFQPRPRQLRNRSRRQHQLQFSNLAVRPQLLQQHQHLQPLLLSCLPRSQSLLRRHQLSRLHPLRLTLRSMYFRCQLQLHQLSWLRFH